MEVLYESGKASGGREESYLLSRSYELQANESHEARFTFSLGPITYRNPRKFSSVERAFAVVATLSIAAASVLNLLSGVVSAVNATQFACNRDKQTEQKLYSSCNCSCNRDVDKIAVAFTCQTDLILGMTIAVNACFVLYYVWDGLFREQKFEILAFVMANILICLYGIVDNAYDAFVTCSKCIVEWWPLTQLIITLILALVNITLACVVFWKMKYLLYFTLGANPVLFKIYRWTRILSTLVKLNFEVIVSLFLLVVTRVPFFLHTTSLHAPLAPHPAEVAIVFGLFLVAILGLALSTIGMYKEMPHLSRAYLGIQFFIALYCAFRIVWTIFWSRNEDTVNPKGDCDATDIIASTIIFLSALGIILTVAIFPVYIIVMRNYGKGLKDKLFG